MTFLNSDEGTSYTAMAGYTRLAEFMVDKKHEIVKVFQSAALRDLLFLQAELIQLEADYDEISRADREAGGEFSMYDGNWRLLSTSKVRVNGGKQWDKALEIREKLREYCSMFQAS